MEREDKMLIMKKLYTRKQLELLHKWLIIHRDMKVDYDMAGFLVGKILQDFRGIKTDK